MLARLFAMARGVLDDGEVAPLTEFPRLDRKVDPGVVGPALSWFERVPAYRWGLYAFFLHRLPLAAAPSNRHACAQTLAGSAWAGTRSPCGGRTQPIVLAAVPYR